MGMPTVKATRTKKVAATVKCADPEPEDLSYYDIDDLLNEVPDPDPSTVSNAQLVANVAAGAIVAGRGFRRFFGG
jgi:hypothetical protein